MPTVTIVVFSVVVVGGPILLLVYTLHEMHWWATRYAEIERAVSLVLRQDQYQMTWRYLMRKVNKLLHERRLQFRVTRKRLLQVIRELRQDNAVVEHQIPTLFGSSRLVRVYQTTLERIEHTM